MLKQLNKYSFNVGDSIAKYTEMVEGNITRKNMISVNRNL